MQVWIPLFSKYWQLQHFHFMLMSANSRIRFGMQIVFVSLYTTPCYYHHCENSSEDIELLIIIHCLGSGHGMRCMCSYILMNLRYGRIASWDIRVLVVLAQNLTVGHWHAAVLPYWVPHWWLIFSIYVLTVIFIRRSLTGRRVSPFC